MPDTAETDTQATGEKTLAKKTKKTTRKKTSKKKKSKRTKPRQKADGTQAGPAMYPRHSVDKALRIPRAILEQNAGKECSDSEAAGFIGLKLNGPVRVEISSALKFGFLNAPRPAASSCLNLEGRSSALNSLRRKLKGYEKLF